MMVLKGDQQQRVKNLLTDTITGLCKSSFGYKSEICIEGLLGITLDNEEVVLVNIKECVNRNSEGLLSFSSGLSLNGVGLGPPDANPHLPCLGNEQDIVTVSCSLAQDGSSLFVSDSPTKVATGIGGGYEAKIADLCDLSKSDGSEKSSDKVSDAFQLSVADVAYAAKLSDLDMLLGADLTMGNRRRDGCRFDSTNTLFNEAEIEQIMGGQKANSPKDDHDLSGASDVVLIKEEYKKMSGAVDMVALTKPADVINLDTLHVGGHGDYTFGGNSHTDSIFCGIKGDDQFPSCSNWDNTDMLDAMPLNLSEPQPQDLTMSPIIKEKHTCGECGKKFKTEQALNKHTDKEHPDEIPVLDMSQPPGALIKDLSSKPLDLTISARGEGEDGEVDLDADLAMYDTESFACICSKVYKDYEAYIDHVALCNKARLTPYKACDICGKYFFSHSGYVKHKRLHVGAYKFRCNICHKGFFDRTHLRAHMDSSHSKVRRYECTYCAKSFFWKHHLKRHLGTCERARSGCGTDGDVEADGDEAMELGDQEQKPESPPI